MKVPEKILSILSDLSAGGQVRLRKKEEKILIAIHIDPDGDAIGSALALSIALESMGKQTFLYSRDPIPKFYRFLPGHNKFSSNQKDVLKSNPTLILLDCSSPERAAIDRYRFRSSIVIDHHETDTSKGTENDFGDTGTGPDKLRSVKWIDRKAAATGMMVFYLLKALGIKFTKDIATNLYTAISIDTGTFRYSNTYADVLRTSAELIESGAEPNLIAGYLYETWDRKRFDLLITALNTLEIKNRIAILHITKDMFKKTGAKPEDTESFSNFPRMIGLVKVSAVFRETGREMWKVSLRSKGDVDVAKVARLYDGGGHKNAAGFMIKADLRSAKEALFKAIRRCEVKKMDS